MPIYRKKPVEVEARLYDPIEGLDAALATWCNGKLCGVLVAADERHILIQTLEGEMQANPGDWIVKGVQGEFYPVKPSIFEATYEQVS